MADLPPRRDPNGGTGMAPDRSSTAATPLWVKVFGAIALVVLVLFVIALLIGGGSHGAGRHAPSGDAAEYAAPSILVAHPVQQP